MPAFVSMPADTLALPPMWGVLSLSIFMSLVSTGVRYQVFTLLRLIYLLHMQIAKQLFYLSKMRSQNW